MRFVTALICAALLAFSAAGNRQTETCTVSLSLESGSGLVRVADTDGKAVAIPGLLSRGVGLAAESPISRWSVLMGPTQVELPRKKLTFHGFTGLDTEMGTITVDLADRDAAKVMIPAKRFYNAASQEYRSANTHLHLMKLSREESDRYLLEVPKADGLDVLFVSYLERAEADREYITNRYSRAELEELGRKSGVAIGNGQEHRHNFAAQGQGYGHVMLLDIKQLVQPVSIGPGIMKMGTDGLPIQRGLELARRDGATAIWCHNNWGFENIPNWVTGRLDAQNIFDGGEHGSYKDSFYRYLNAGLRVPFSTGTDWFMYDFARVYVTADKPLSPRDWLKQLAAGRSYITNGPFLEFRVAGKTLGDTVKLNGAESVTIVARGIGRTDFERIELVRNGDVIRVAKTQPEGGHFTAEMRFELNVTGPCWLALRTPPPAVKNDPELTAKVPQNELGQPLFSHTSPIYVEFAGRSYFDPAVAQAMLAEVERNMSEIEKLGTFADNLERSRVLEVHAEAAGVLRKSIAAAR